MKGEKTSRVLSPKSEDFGHPTDPEPQAPTLPGATLVTTYGTDTKLEEVAIRQARDRDRGAISWDFGARNGAATGTP